MIKADYISPHKGTGWHPNDFAVGEQYVAYDRVFTVISIEPDKWLDFRLDIKWVDNSAPGSVYPNSEWIALNWTETP